jgi:hypothetical protein
MLFDAVIDQHHSALRAFFRNPQHPALILQVDADLELVVARFLVGFSAKGRTNDTPEELVFGISASFIDPSSFYANAAAQVAEALSELEEELRDADPELVLPEPLDLKQPWPPTRSIEAAFAEYVESVARSVGGFWDTLVLVLRLDDIQDVEAARLSLGQLGGMLAYPGLKLVLIDDRARSSSPSKAGERPRPAWPGGPWVMRSNGQDSTSRAAMRSPSRPR